MDTTQTLACIFLLTWAGVLIWIGYRFGLNDGVQKGEQQTAERQQTAVEDLTRKLGEARALNQRLRDHFDVLDRRLNGLAAPSSTEPAHRIHPQERRELALDSSLGKMSSRPSASLQEAR